MTAVVIDTSALLKVLYTSLLAGVGVAVVYALAIYGATRSTDMRRDGRSKAAAMFATLALIALAASAGAVVYGVVLVGRKG